RYSAAEIEGDDAEVGRRARDPQQPVLAAGEIVGLDGDGPENLREGDGHKGVVNATAMRDKQRDQDAGDERSNRRGGEGDPQVGREVELAEAEGKGTDAEIGARSGA